jgi:riboflavin synthase
MLGEFFSAGVVLFTGLIQDIGKIQSLDRKGEGVFLSVVTRLTLSDVKIGDSISVDGACLTVVKLSHSAFTADVSLETLKRTTLAKAGAGQRVNLEKSLRFSDFLGGHLVSGHVDGTGEIIKILPEGNSWRYRFRAPQEISRYLIEKGSVAVDGISLTVAEIEEPEFTVAVVPYTAQSTTLGLKKIGDPVNLEIDPIAKYVEKFLRQADRVTQKNSRIDADFLAQHGFMKTRE